MGAAAVSVSLLSLHEAGNPISFLFSMMTSFLVTEVSKGVIPLYEMSLSTAIF